MSLNLALEDAIIFCQAAFALSERTFQHQHKYLVENDKKPGDLLLVKYPLARSLVFVCLIVTCRIGYLLQVRKPGDTRT